MASKTICRIIQALHEMPGLSSAEIAGRAHISEKTLAGSGYLRTLKRSGQIYISGWRRNASGAFTTPLYSAGSGEDCKRPRITVENRSSPGMARLLAAIEKYGPIDYRVAATLAGLSRNTVKNSGYLEALINQKKIHVSGWRHSRNGPMRAIYAFGPGSNLAPPAPLSNAEKLRLHRQRRKEHTGLVAIQVQLLLGSFTMPTPRMSHPG